jgi:hypothetical protein
MPGLVASKCTVRGCVDALVAVVPADSVSGVRIVTEHLLDHSAARDALGRLRLGENTIAT